MKSQIPAAAAAYFEARHVHGEHPVITALFRPTHGWKPLSGSYRVSHTLLVSLQADGVTGVQLTAGGYSGQPEFGVEELIGRMGALDAEMTDGIPVREGSSATGTEPDVTRVLTTIGLTVQQAAEYLDQADAHETEFIVERREFCAVDPRGRRAEGWRYRLVKRAQIQGGGPGYELSVLSHEGHREAVR